jgi:hypothetical protein
MPDFAPMELDGMGSHTSTDHGNRHPFREPIAGGELRIGSRRAPHGPDPHPTPSGNAESIPPYRPQTATRRHLSTVASARTRRA